MRRKVQIAFLGILFGLGLPHSVGEPSGSSEERIRPSASELAFVLDRSHPAPVQRKLRGVEVELDGELLAEFSFPPEDLQPPLGDFAALGRAPVIGDGKPGETTVTVRELLDSNSAGERGQVRSVQFRLDPGLNVFWISYELIVGERGQVATPTLLLQKGLGGKLLRRTLLEIESVSKLNAAMVGIEVDVGVGVRKELAKRRKRLGFPPLRLRVDDSPGQEFALRIPWGTSHSRSKVRLPYRFLLPPGRRQVQIEDSAVDGSSPLEIRLEPGQFASLTAGYTHRKGGLRVAITSP